MMNLLASVSQWEREIIGERTSSALQHLKAQGLPYCSGAFGQGAGDAQTLAYMKQARIEGLTYQAIADQLTADLVPTVRGGRWQKATVMLMLRNAGHQLGRQHHGNNRKTAHG
jgi:site-specific DNA recombinase